eukprot:2965213-Pleurochrysis_carterae.AAC.1
MRRRQSYCSNAGARLSEFSPSKAIKGQVFLGVGAGEHGAPLQVAASGGALFCVDRPRHGHHRWLTRGAAVFWRARLATWLEEHVQALRGALSRLCSRVGLACCAQPEQVRVHLGGRARIPSTGAHAARRRGGRARCVCVRACVLHPGVRACVRACVRVGGRGGVRACVRECVYA